jgi:hypothetical protein
MDYENWMRIALDKIELLCYNKNMEELDNASPLFNFSK